MIRGNSNNSSFCNKEHYKNTITVHHYPFATKASLSLVYQKIHTYFTVLEIDLLIELLFLPEFLILVGHVDNSLHRLKSEKKTPIIGHMCNYAAEMKNDTNKMRQSQ